MKSIKSKVFVLASALSWLFTQDISAQSINDGPYVIYQDGKPMVKRVVEGKAEETTLINNQVAIQFKAHPEWDFTVKLKPNHKIEPSETPGSEKLFFISDIEGEFEGFRKLLLDNKLINEKYDWTFGNGHLVICGDLFDRGLSVPESIWLIYKLEQSAKAAGGYVHTILGNHDIMNLSGDLRYVQPKYIESAKLMGVEYMSLMGIDSEIGRWLRSKNTIEKIGDNLCAHAGISPQINKLGMNLKQINDTCRPYYDKAKLMRGVGDAAADPFFSAETSLFWYRGYFMEPKATEEEVNQTLGLFGVNRIIVGHTIVPGNVGFYYGKKVLGLDVNQHGGDHQAALYENGQWWKVGIGGKKEQL